MILLGECGKPAKLPKVPLLEVHCSGDDCSLGTIRGAVHHKVNLDLGYWIMIIYDLKQMGMTAAWVLSEEQCTIRSQNSDPRRGLKNSHSYSY